MTTHYEKYTFNGSIKRAINPRPLLLVRFGFLGLFKVIGIDYHIHLILGSCQTRFKIKMLSQ